MKERQGCIYSAINSVNGKEYIGKDKTGDPENNRWKFHRKAALKAKPRGYFHRALKAAGGHTRFKWAVIWRGPVECLSEKEIYYIKRRHTFVGDPACRGYNLTIGGDGTSGYTQRRSAKKKIAKSVVKQWKTQRECMLAAIRGCVRTPTKAVRVKIGNSVSALWARTVYRKNQMSKRFPGWRKASKKTRALQSANIQAEWAAKSDEARAAVALARSAGMVAYYDRVGRKPKPVYKRSPQVRANMAKAARARWQKVAVR